MQLMDIQKKLSYVYVRKPKSRVWCFYLNLPFKILLRKMLAAQTSAVIARMKPDKDPSHGGTPLLLKSPNSS